MAETATAPGNTESVTAKSVKGGKSKDAKKPKAKPSHPKTGDMVTAAIKNLKERNGSSLQAIKKYIASNYKVDAEKLAPFIKKYLKAAVTSGSLVQTKGKGASGSFKLKVAGDKTSSGAVKKVKAQTKAKKAKTSGEKKAAEPKAKKPKTAAAVKKSGSPKKAAPKTKTVKAVKAASSPSKAKKTTKSPTKPKAPKPKKVSKPKTAKKASPKKK